MTKRVVHYSSVNGITKSFLFFIYKVYLNKLLNTNLAKILAKIEKFSKTTRQKSKIKIDSDRVNDALLEYAFILKFCRLVFEIFAFEVYSWYKIRLIRLR